MQRREFITTTALTAAAAMLPKNNFAQTAQLKKAVLISMLPKEMPYLDRFKLAIDCGF